MLKSLIRTGYFNNLDEFSVKIQTTDFTRVLIRYGKKENLQISSLIGLKTVADTKCDKFHRC